MEIPESIINAEKLFNPMTIEGVLLTETMAKIGEIAQELYDEEPDFVALVPFGSRTKGLAKVDSDIDLCLIVENNTMKRQHIKDRLTQKLEGYKIPWRHHIIEPARSDYECTLGGIAVKKLGSNILSVPFSPNRLEKSIIIARRGSARSKEMTVEVLIEKLEESERHSIENKITNTVQSEQFIRNRMHLWKKRISELLEYQEENQD